MTRANATTRGDEDRQEPDHVAVFGRELRPVRAEEVAERLGQVRREQEREQDRGDAEQAADGALGEAQHEERRRSRRQMSRSTVLDAVQERPDPRISLRGVRAGPPGAAQG